MVKGISRREGSPSLPLDGSSTNPNTPRSPTPDKLEPGNNEPVEVNSSPKSTTSGEHTGDIQRTWPKSIDVTKVKAIASWGGHRLPNLFLDLHWHPTSHKAFFKLRTTVTLLNGANRRDGRTSIYLYIYPERIRQLSVDPDPSDKALGADSLLLRFELDTPSALVLPRTPCEPKGKVANDVMDAFRALAGQTSFSVYANIPRKKLCVKRIRELCAAAADGGLVSLAMHASAASLYQGKGGEVIERTTPVRPDDGPLPATEEFPPRYSEPSPVEPSSAAPGDYKGKKRRCVDSSSPEPTEPASLKAMQALLNSSLSSLERRFDDRLAAHKKEVAEMLDKTEARILDSLRSDVELRCDGMQDFLQHRVHEEMADVEDSVMRSLSEMPLQATLTFPLHPWY